MSTENKEWLEFKISLGKRLKAFALEIIKLVQGLPYRTDTKVISNQVMKSGTSSYANYRASLRGRSKAEFFSKLCIAVEEIDETELWLELIIESGISDNDQTRALHSESLELVKILSHLRKTMSTI